MISITCEKKRIQTFLKQMKEILYADAFNIDRDFVFQMKRSRDDANDDCTNQATVNALGYTRHDIVEELKGLELSHYSESVIDDVVVDSFLHIFVKEIAGRQVYIKIRLKRRTERPGEYVYCISFHFARYKISHFPFR